MLHKYIASTCKTEQAASSTLHIITKYLQETNMSPKLETYAIYAKYLMCIDRGCICLNMPHMNHVH